MSFIRQTDWARKIRQVFKHASPLSVLFLKVKPPHYQEITVLTAESSKIYKILVSELVLLLSYFLLTYILCIFANLVLFQSKNHPAKRTLLFASASLPCASPSTLSVVCQLQGKERFRWGTGSPCLQNPVTSVRVQQAHLLKCTCITYFTITSTCPPIGTKVWKAQGPTSLLQAGAQFTACWATRNTQDAVFSIRFITHQLFPKKQLQTLLLTKPAKKYNTPRKKHSISVSDEDTCKKVTIQWKQSLKKILPLQNLFLLGLEMITEEQLCSHVTQLNLMQNIWHKEEQNPLPSVNFVGFGRLTTTVLFLIWKSADPTLSNTRSKSIE